MRVQDLLDEKILRAKVEGALDLKNQILTKVYNRRAVSAEETAMSASCSVVGSGITAQSP